MEVYIVIIHDWAENEHYPLGVYSTRAKAGEAMDGYMATDFGLSEYTDWELDDLAGNWQYFYGDFTVEIQRFPLDA